MNSQEIAFSNKNASPTTITPITTATAMPRPMTIAPSTTSERKRCQSRTYAPGPTTGRSTVRRRKPTARRELTISSDGWLRPGLGCSLPWFEVASHTERRTESSWVRPYGLS